MKLFKQISILLFLTPSLLHASSCPSIIFNINKVISKHVDALPAHSLPWLELSWLQKNLGNASVSRLADNQMEYKWLCRVNTANYLVVKVDARNNMVSINGEYSNGEGSGLFSSEIAQPINVSQESNSINSLSKTSNRKDEVLRSIVD